MNKKIVQKNRKRISNYSQTKSFMYLYDNTKNHNSDYYLWKEQKVSFMIWKGKTEEEIVQFIKSKYSFRNYNRELNKKELLILFDNNV